MVIVSFIGGAIFVTFSQGVRIWHASVRESEKGKEEFFFEELKSELRNAFLYKKSALLGQSQMIEFYTLDSQLRGKGKHLKAWKVPAQIRYRFDPQKKLIQKEVNYYEKMLNRKSKLSKSEATLQFVENMNIEYYQQPKTSSSASWVGKWADTCFPEAVKVTIETQSGLRAKVSRIISIPAIGECTEQEEAGV